MIKTSKFITCFHGVKALANTNAIMLKTGGYHNKQQ